MERQDLVRRAQKGDTEAFAKLYEEIYQDLYKFALYALGSVEDAEDAVSEAVMDGFAEIKSLRSEEAFRGWMFRILSAKCRQKRKGYLNRTGELSDILSAEEKDLPEMLDVRRAFSLLEWEDRMILALHLFGGYRTREIGQLLHMKHSTVRSRERRALKRMEKWLS